MKCPWIEAMMVDKELVAQPDTERVWPAEIEALTSVIEREHRQGILSDGQLMVFGMSMAYKALNGLEDEPRREKFEQFCDLLESILFPTETSNG